MPAVALTIALAAALVVLSSMPLLYLTASDAKLVGFAFNFLPLCPLW